MTDDGRLTSNTVSIDLTIDSTNDEPPQIVNTPISQTYIEEAGPVNVLSVNAYIRDVDNCVNHTLIERLEVILQNPVEGEDQLISMEGVYSDFSIRYSCDMTVNMSCYDDFLRSLQYNNTNIEPDFGDRFITIEVSCLTSYGYDIIAIN